MLRSKTQFSIATLLVVTAIVALFVRPTGKSWTDGVYTAYSDTNHRLVVATGIRNDKLLFVAITGDPKHSETSTTSIVTGGSTKDHNWYKLNYPDGTVEMLPKRGVQLFQYIDGKWSESKGDVTPKEYEKFCNSKPEHFTIESLLEFVANQRRNDR